MKFTAYLDLTGWFQVGVHKSHSKTWESATTEKLTLEIQHAPQDIPDLGNLDAMRRYYRDRLRRVRGAIISCDLVMVGNLQGLRTIFKIPAGVGLAMRFTAELLVRLGNRLAGLRICAEESGITGIREALVMGELSRSANPSQLEQLRRSEIPLEWKFERYEPNTRGEFAYCLSDDENYDHRFPLHPLTIVRRRMRWLEKSFSVSAAAASASHEVAAIAETKESGGLLSRLARTLGRDRQPFTSICVKNKIN